MKNFFYKFLNKILGKHLTATPKTVILSDLNERRPLPLGVTEFEEWADRIISGSLLPVQEESMKFALASMLMSLDPREDHKEDLFFIKSLRKSCVNQVAHAKIEEIKKAAKARQTEEESKKETDKVAAQEQVKKEAEATLTRISSNNKGEATPESNGIPIGKQVLGNGRV